MHRLAWFTPTPPSRSGIAAYCEELLPLLSSEYAIDVFTAPLVAGHPRPDGHPPVFEGHDFAWKHFRAPYDLAVYQLGNATCHAFMWPHLFRHPGLVVLHDAQLHHSRAWSLLRQGRVDDYRAEFRANHPGEPEHLPDLFIRGLADSAYYLWPMLDLVIRSARLVAVHSPRLATALSAQFGVEVDAVRMGVRDWPQPAGADAVERRRELRARYGIAPDAVVFAAFVHITPEKRITPVLQAMAEVLRFVPTARLLLVGSTVDHYDAMAEARVFGVERAVVLAGYVPDEEILAHLAAADVCLNLRWPTGGETSASWLRALAAGLPTVVTDLAHHDEMAVIDPRTWTTLAAGSGQAAADPIQRPVCVAIDPVQERFSLTVAMLQLARYPGLRAGFSKAAREHWAREHTLARMADDYGKVIEHALSRPIVPPRDLPAHLVADGTARARSLTAPFGVDVDFLGRGSGRQPGAGTRARADAS
jgi:glycosyltransferase involved in cell wall biosynthesis